MGLTILLWQRVPYAADETPGMPTYRIAGTAGGRVFVVDVACEIDGRDCEITHVAGRRIDTGDMWEALQEAMAAREDLSAEMQAEATRYYEAAAGG